MNPPQAVSAPHAGIEQWIQRRSYQKVLELHHKQYDKIPLEASPPNLVQTTADAMVVSHDGKAAAEFAAIDTNSDGLISREEFVAAKLNEAGAEVMNHLNATRSRNPFLVV